MATFKRRIFTRKVIYRLFQLNVGTFQKCKNAHACALRDCLGVSRPFVSDTSPKCIDREGLERRRIGIRQGASKESPVKGLVEVKRPYSAARKGEKHAPIEAAKSIKKILFGDQAKRAITLKRNHDPYYQGCALFCTRVVVGTPSKVLSFPPILCSRIQRTYRTTRAGTVELLDRL